MFDPHTLGERVRSVVCRGFRRKYFRFRATRFYGGTATADVVGCNLRCVYCWNWRINNQYARVGVFYSPESVAERLVHISLSGGFNALRLSGGEPTLCMEHLLTLLDNVPAQFLFILETNGIVLSDKKYVRALSKYPNLFVRVSLKGVDRESFERVTGARGDFFDKQIEALRNLSSEGISARPALPFQLFPKDAVRDLQARLLDIDETYVLELEPVLDYGGAYARIKRAGLRLYPWL